LPKMGVAAGSLAVGSKDQFGDGTGLWSEQLQWHGCKGEWSGTAVSSRACACCVEHDEWRLPLAYMHGKPRCRWRMPPLHCIVAFSLPTVLMLASLATIAARHERSCQWPTMNIFTSCGWLSQMKSRQRGNGQSIPLQRVHKDACKASHGWTPADLKGACEVVACGFCLQDFEVALAEHHRQPHGCYDIGHVDARASIPFDGVLWLKVTNATHVGSKASAAAARKHACEGIHQHLVHRHVTIQPNMKHESRTATRSFSASRRLQPAEELATTSSPAINVKMLGPGNRAAMSQKLGSENVQVQVLGPLSETTSHDATQDSGSTPANVGRTLAWPPTPDPWLVSFGSHDRDTARGPSSTTVPPHQTAVIYPVTGIVIGTIICCCVCATIAVVGCHVKKPFSYVPLLQRNGLRNKGMELAKFSRDAEVERTPEDLFFRSADLADRVLANRGLLFSSEVKEELRHLQELQRLREQVAACASHGDADRRRLALATEALDIAARSRTLASWWAPTPLLSHEVSQLREECIQLGIFDTRIVRLPAPTDSSF